ncbi:hypothetical protein BD311DRAFT_351764 [Dichomitus squalens]|uniref:Uncharacterized protein n=1 Tax=Dichomitus squalens TaxID=114155 RepID=A0A4Q9N646_9APHY|nr:hypothetical protein BD311DRAFT_351764 [Dichomitus squalens]
MHHTGSLGVTAGIVGSIIGVAAIVSALVIVVRKWGDRLARKRAATMVGMDELGTVLVRQWTNTTAGVGERILDTARRSRIVVVDKWRATTRALARLRRSRRSGSAPPGPPTVHRLVNLSPLLYNPDDPRTFPPMPSPQEIDLYRRHKALQPMKCARSFTSVATGSTAADQSPFPAVAGFPRRPEGAL